MKKYIVRKYAVVEREYLPDLVSQVNTLIDEKNPSGCIWQPLGPVSTSIVEIKFGGYLQAMALVEFI